MKGRLYAVGIFGAVLIVLGLLIENELKEALQWIGTGMLVSFVFLISSYNTTKDNE